MCHHCGKRGHIKRACKSRGKQNPKRKGSTNTVRHLKDEDVEEGEGVRSDSQTSALFQVNSKGIPNAPPIKVKVKLDDCLMDMEVDTGASVSLMSESAFRKLWPGRHLDPSPIRLQTYLKEPIPVVGCCYVHVEYKGQCCKGPLVIVCGSGPTLLGRDWLSQILLDWREIHQVYTASLQAVLSRYPGVFQEGIGNLRGFKAKIYVDPNTPPRFYPARSVPFACRTKWIPKLQRLEKEGIIEPVEFSEWAAPIVVALKQNSGNVRICGDFCITVNPVSKLDWYPIPKVEDVLYGSAMVNISLSLIYAMPINSFPSMTTPRSTLS